MRCALLAIALALLCAPAGAVAQPPGTPVRVGFLSAASPTGDTIHRAFVEGLREHGYTPGQNLVVESRWAEERFERLPELVMIGVADPVGAGLVTSLARSGGNVTGTSGAFTQIVGKQLGLLKETFPDVSRVTVLWNPANPVYQALQLREAQIAARTLRIELQLVETRTVGELEKVFAAVARRQPLLLMGDPLFTTHRQRISQLAAARRIPVVTGVSGYAEAGAMLTYGPSFPTWPAAPQSTPTRSSRVRGRPICPWKSEPHSSWSSISGPQDRLG
jgi:putative ABC transport system substrate-binding protein